jgi:6-pyruvoyl-tetrahydropterin synthase
VRCSLTRSVALHARHHLGPSVGGGAPADQHGHLYRIAVTVTGPGAAHGVVMDLELFDAILAAEIVAPLDGRVLNDVVPEFSAEHLPATCEGVAMWCWARVARRLPSDVRLERVRVAENDTLWADCTGPA